MTKFDKIMKGMELVRLLGDDCSISFTNGMYGDKELYLYPDGGSTIPDHLFDSMSILGWAYLKSLGAWSIST
jgi:hypothetical protein